VLIRGAGEMASGVAHRLHRCHFKLCMLEVPQPLAVRRTVSFCEAVYDGEKDVEGVKARLAGSPEAIASVWKDGEIAVRVDPAGTETRRILKPHCEIDAILAKKNLNTRMDDAPWVIGLGPGFTAGEDVHAVIETNRGHDLGKAILRGCAEPDTGIPGEIGGFRSERVFRAPKAGVFRANCSIADRVEQGDLVASVDGDPVIAGIGGMVRGLIRDGAVVMKGMKVGDIDPRGKREYCFTISDKARAIAGGVLEAILYRFNRSEG
jgi:xanthine dehydrogenase accessory factor